MGSGVQGPKRVCRLQDYGMASTWVYELRPRPPFVERSSQLCDEMMVRAPWLVNAQWLVPPHLGGSHTCL